MGEPTARPLTTAVMAAPPVIPNFIHQLPADIAADSPVSPHIALCGVRVRWRLATPGAWLPPCNTCALGAKRLRQAVEPLLAERDVLRRRCELLEAAATHDQEEPVAVRPARDPWAETARLRERVAELEASYRELELTAGGRLDASGQAVAELQRAHDATRSALSGLATAAELHAAACGCGSYGEVEATKQALETAVTGARVRLGGVTRRALPADDDTAELTPAVHRPPAAEPLDGIVDADASGSATSFEGAKQEGGAGR